jgi:hypothetical protein
MTTATKDAAFKLRRPIHMARHSMRMAAAGVFIPPYIFLVLTMFRARYAMERTNSTIKVWFWARNDASVPAEVVANTGGVSPANWGLPYAAFTTTATCNIGQVFGPNRIIINLTLCTFSCPFKSTRG